MMGPSSIKPVKNINVEIWEFAYVAFNTRSIRNTTVPNLFELRRGFPISIIVRFIKSLDETSRYFKNECKIAWTNNCESLKKGKMVGWWSLNDDEIKQIPLCCCYFICFSFYKKIISEIVIARTNDIFSSFITSKSSSVFSVLCWCLETP